MSYYKKIKIIWRARKNKVEHRQRAKFYANISHDLKTPINIIYSAIQVMNMALDNKK